jgi:hypothetical protein
MNRSWNELSKEEKEEMIKKWEKLKRNGYSCSKIKEETEKNYKIKVSRQTIFRELNPEKKKLYRNWRLAKMKAELESIRMKRDYILQEVKRGFEKNLSEKEIVRRLNENLPSLPPYLIRWTVDGLLQLLKNPEISLRKIFKKYRLQPLYSIGINYARKVYNLSPPNEKELIKSALEKGPLTTSEIKKMKKGISRPSQIIHNLKKDPKYKLNIFAIHLPFSGNQYIYFLEEHREEAIKRAKDETLKKLDFVSYLKKYKFDEKGKEALLNILFKPYVSEDDENIKLLRKYKGAFNRLQAHVLKCIEFNGKKYYSFWNYRKINI